MSKKRTFVLLLLIYLIWGSNFSVMKVAITYIPPLTFSGLRYVIGGSMLVIFSLAWGVPLPKRGDWGPIVVFGLLQTTLTYAFVIYGMSFVEAGVSSILIYSYPLFVNLMAHFILPEEKLNMQKVFGLLVGFIGLIVVFSDSSFNLNDTWAIIGKLMIIMGAFVWAAATIYLKVKLSQQNKLQLTAWQMLIGGTVGLIFGLVMDRGLTISFTPLAITALAYTSIMASAITFALWFYLLDYMGAGRASAFLFLVPIFSVIFATLMLNEPFTWRIVLGLFAVVSGICLVNYTPSQVLEADKRYSRR